MRVKMSRTFQPVDVVWDTDIGRDSDDALALLWMLSRPEIRLRCITISPGDKDQVGLTTFLLRECGVRDVPIGVVPGRPSGKKSVSGCHVRLMDYHHAKATAEPDGVGWQVLRDALSRWPSAVLLTTGPLNNVGDLLRETDVSIEHSVTMGGYCNLGPGPATEPEFNFNGCGWAARGFVETKRIGRRMLVGKNVTHQVLYYGDQLHTALREAGVHCRSLALAHELMGFQTARARHKKLHDPLAAIALLREDMFSWQEVMPFKHDGEWGSKLCPASGLWAATNVSVERFRALFAGNPG